MSASARISHSGILHKTAAYDSSAATQTDHAQAHAIVGARDGGVGPRIHAARGSRGGYGSRIKKFTAVHDVNASLMAL